jgi:hypothetical protein
VTNDLLDLGTKGVIKTDGLIIEPHSHHHH